MPDLGLIEGCDFYFVDAVDAEEGMCNETTSTCGRTIPVGSNVVRSVVQVPAEPVAHGAAHDQLDVASLSQGISAPSHRAARAAALGRTSPFRGEGG